MLLRFNMCMEYCSTYNSCDYRSVSELVAVCKSATWFFLTKENPMLLTLDMVLVFISLIRQDFFHILTSEPYLLKISPFISLSVCFCSSWKDATPFDTRSGDLMTCYRLTNPKISCKGFGAVGKRMLLSLDHQDSSTYHRIVLTNCSLNLGR